MRSDPSTIASSAFVGLFQGSFDVNHQIPANYPSAPANASVIQSIPSTGDHARTPTSGMNSENIMTPQGKGPATTNHSQFKMDFGPPQYPFGPIFDPSDPPASPVAPSDTPSGGIWTPLPGGPAGMTLTGGLMGHLPVGTGGEDPSDLSVTNLGMSFQRMIGDHRAGDFTTSAASMAQMSSGTALCKPSATLLSAMESVDSMWRTDHYRDCSIEERTVVEVVTGYNLNEFCVGTILSIHPPASNDPPSPLNSINHCPTTTKGDLSFVPTMENVIVPDRNNENDYTHHCDWFRVHFENQGTMVVPAIRCRLTEHPYPYRLNHNGSNTHSMGKSPNRVELVDARELESPRKEPDATMATNKKELSDAPTPLKPSAFTHPDNPSVQDGQQPSPGQSSISPPQWNPAWAAERKPSIAVFRPGDAVEIFLPAAEDTPPRWVRSKIIRPICEDPRVVKINDLELAIPLNHSIPADSSSWHCARFWGGYCQCSLNHSQRPCMGLQGGIINLDVHPFFYEVTLPTSSETHNTGTTQVICPWQFVRRPNISGGLNPAEIVSVEAPLPPFLTSVPMSFLALNSLCDESRSDQSFTSDSVWLNSDCSRRLLNQIRHYSRVLLYEIVRVESNASKAALGHAIADEYKVVFIGTNSQTITSTNYLNGEVNHIRSSVEFFERREKRLKLLEERKSRYERNEQLEFEADDSLVGLIIGKQGEQLSKVARTYKVEIRVLPDDQGFRRVRIYGGNLVNAQKAMNELVYCFKYMPITKEVCRLMTDRRGSMMKDIASRFNINSIWIDSGSHDDGKNGVRDSTVVAAAEAAAVHPVKCRDIIRGTASHPVLVICGIETSVLLIEKTILEVSSTYNCTSKDPSMTSNPSLDSSANGKASVTTSTTSINSATAATQSTSNSTSSKSANQSIVSLGATLHQALSLGSHNAGYSSHNSQAGHGSHQHWIGPNNNMNAFHSSKYVQPVSNDGISNSHEYGTPAGQAAGAAIAQQLTGVGKRGRRGPGGPDDDIMRGRGRSLVGRQSNGGQRNRNNKTSTGTSNYSTPFSNNRSGPSETATTTGGRNLGRNAIVPGARMIPRVSRNGTST